jgi:acyl-CoA synthetase (NDP forming)
MEATNHRLTDAHLAQALLAPRSIALIGASGDPGKTASRPLRFLLDSGFKGSLYPVNPARATVLGVASYPSVAALPEVPDHAFILTPTDGVLEAARRCAERGIRVVTILASGFAESGPQGASREQALRTLASQTGLRILGPSSIGVVNPRNGLVLTANAAFAEPDLPVGDVFVASHSGSMIGALVSRGKSRGVGFAGLVSVGGEVDLSIGEVCSSTLDDPGVKGYMLFLESLQHGDQLRAFARAAALRGKPVVAYKLGRSAEAAEMATTHTGALAGEDDVADAFLRDCGIARVGVLDALLETLPLARRIELAASNPRLRVGVVTTTGGGAAMAVDQLGLRGVTVQPASAETLAAMGQRGIQVSAGRVVDLTLAGTKYDVMKAVLDVMLQAPEFDLVLATIGSSARFQPELAVKPIIDASTHARPLAAMLVPEAPQALAALTAAGVPCFRSPEACADAIAAVSSRRHREVPFTQQAAGHRGNVVGLDEAEAYEVLQGLGVPHAPFVLVDPAAPEPVLSDLQLAVPLALKVCSRDIPHKTEVGGVQLGIDSQPALASAWRMLKTNLAERAPGKNARRFMLQSMRKGLGEVLVGFRHDADAGPIVLLAAGGIWTEVTKDRAIRLAPVDIETAREMVGEVRALRTLSGLRGQPAGDLEALAQAVVAMSQLAVRPELEVREAEVNPLIVMAAGAGVLAVDALVVRNA